MPAYFKRLQFKADSTRAIEWFQKTKDSSYLEKYTLAEPVINKEKPADENKFPGNRSTFKMAVAVLPDEKYLRIMKEHGIA